MNPIFLGIPLMDTDKTQTRHLIIFMSNLTVQKNLLETMKNIKMLTYYRFILQILLYQGGLSSFSK